MTEKKENLIKYHKGNLPANLDSLYIGDSNSLSPDEIREVAAFYKKHTPNMEVVAEVYDSEPKRVYYLVPKTTPTVYALRIEIRDGESEYQQTRYVTGEDRASAWDAVRRIMQEYGENDGSDVYWSPDGTVAVEAQGITPVNELTEYADGPTRTDVVRFIAWMPYAPSPFASSPDELD